MLKGLLHRGPHPHTCHIVGSPGPQTPGALTLGQWRPEARHRCEGGRVPVLEELLVQRRRQTLTPRTRPTQPWGTAAGHHSGISVLDRQPFSPLLSFSPPIPCSGLGKTSRLSPP